MFESIPPAMKRRMEELEAIDTRDREDGTHISKRLRQVPPETGKFIALMASLAPAGRCLEIGTSAGYSTMWLSLACRALGRTLTTFEVLPNKIELARETFRQAGIDDIVELVHGDARDHLPALDGIAFCFLDAEKDVYTGCYDLLVPRMVPGGLIVADNVTSHADDLAPFVAHVLADPRVDAMVVTFAKGELLARKR
jgi:predicted O-methyltransferase YrrM